MVGMRRSERDGWMKGQELQMRGKMQGKMQRTPGKAQSQTGRLTFDGLIR